MDLQNFSNLFPYEILRIHLWFNKVTHSHDIHEIQSFWNAWNSPKKMTNQLLNSLLWRYTHRMILIQTCWKCVRQKKGEAKFKRISNLTHCIVAWKRKIDLINCYIFKKSLGQLKPHWYTFCNSTKSNCKQESTLNHQIEPKS